MRRYTNIALPDELADQIEEVIRKTDMGYKSKSEFVKDAVRNLLIKVAEYQNLKKNRAKFKKKA